MTRAPYAALGAAHGLSPAHPLLLDAVPPGARTLDVGCATGYLAAELAARGCAVVGAEADPAAAAAAASGAVERVVAGDVEASACRAELRALAPFDAVVCGDVLEHLRDPWDALTFLATLLARDGRAAVSVPNVPHWTARRALLRGRFPYAEHRPVRQHAPSLLHARERAGARLRPELFALQIVLVAKPALSAPSTPARASR